VRVLLVADGAVMIAVEWMSCATGVRMAVRFPSVLDRPLGALRLAQVSDTQKGRTQDGESPDPSISAVIRSDNGCLIYAGELEVRPPGALHR